MDVDVSQLGAGQLPNRLFRRVVWDVPQLLLRGSSSGAAQHAYLRVGGHFDLCEPVLDLGSERPAGRSEPGVCQLGKRAEAIASPSRSSA
jgi:hypothetical protein